MKLRLVATMKIQGVTEILTFNHGDFTRYPGIVILPPYGRCQGKLPV